MQPVVNFILPADRPDLAGLYASHWRQKWVDAGIGTFDRWNQQRVVARHDALRIFPASPEASDWLLSVLDGVAGVVATAVGDVVPMELNERPVGVRAEADKLHAYLFPRMVVAKGGGDWSDQFATPLPDALGGKIVHMIEAALVRDLSAWHRLPDYLKDGSPFLVLHEAGRPAVIPAIEANRSGHGKAVHVLVRRELTVLSPLRIQGDLFVGPLGSLGFGRMVRKNPPDMLDRTTQRALLSLPTFAPEVDA